MRVEAGAANGLHRKKLAWRLPFVVSAANQDRMLRQKGQEHLVGPPIIRSARTNVDQIGSRGARWELKLKVHAPSGREPLLNTDPS